MPPRRAHAESSGVWWSRPTRSRSPHGGAAPPAVSRYGCAGMWWAARWRWRIRTCARSASTAYHRRGCHWGCQTALRSPPDPSRSPIHEGNGGEPAGIRTQDTRIKSLAGWRSQGRLNTSGVHPARGRRAPGSPRRTDSHRRGCQRGCQGVLAAEGPGRAIRGRLRIGAGRHQEGRRLATTGKVSKNATPPITPSTASSACWKSG